MDIQILLWLQGLREATGSFLGAFLTFITTISVDYFIMVPVLILFWSVNKKNGARVLLTWGTSLGLGALLKTIFCVYRPWVRDARIQPPANVKAGATGYSFPSGHSFSMGGLWNGLAMCYRKYKPMVVFAVIMVLTVMFSRIYFGVHTPQDVLVGAGISVLSAFVINWLCDWVDKKNGRDTIVMIVITALIVALLFYLRFKAYPMDYVDGVLLVDPKKMTVDGFKDPGRFFGIVLGWYIERKWIKFDVSGTTMQKVMRALAGGLLAIFWWTAVATPIGNLIGTGVGHFFTQASTPALFMTVYPMIFKRIERRRARTAA